MFVLDDLLESKIATVVVLSVGAWLATPVLKPVAKAVIKRGIMAYDTIRQAAASAAETTNELVAEVRTEMAEGTEEHPPQRAETNASRSRITPVATTPSVRSPSVPLGNGVSACFECFPQPAETRLAAGSHHSRVRDHSAPARMQKNKQRPCQSSWEAQQNHVGSLGNRESCSSKFRPLKR
jgi:hypothetical protein